MSNSSELLMLKKENTLYVPLACRVHVFLCELVCIWLKLCGNSSVWVALIRWADKCTDTQHRAGCKWKQNINQQREGEKHQVCLLWQQVSCHANTDGQQAISCSLISTCSRSEYSSDLSPIKVKSSVSLSNNSVQEVKPRNLLICSPVSDIKY